MYTLNRSLVKAYMYNVMGDPYLIGEPFPNTPIKYRNNRWEWHYFINEIPALKFYQDKDGKDAIDWLLDDIALGAQSIIDRVMKKSYEWASEILKPNTLIIAEASLTEDLRRKKYLTDKDFEI